MENHHFQWVNPLFLWPFSIAFCMFTRGYTENMDKIWVNFITTEACSPEPWNPGLFEGNHPLLWPYNSG